MQQIKSILIGWEETSHLCTMWNCISKVGKIGAPWTFLAITPSFLILGGSNFHHMFTTLWGMF